jgi:omega-6 fatty acid desaturase (delta-12 desaturase)
MYHASMTRDETYVPKTRSDLGIPEDDGSIDYDEIFGDTPLYTLFLLIRQQVLGFPAYLSARLLAALDLKILTYSSVFNVSSHKGHSKGTNHFNR